MNCRILFVLATGFLFAPLSWSDNDNPPDSVPAVFNPQPASLISPPDSPLNIDCSRAIPLEDGELVWGSHTGFGDAYAWYSFTPAINGTLKITMNSADPDIPIGLMIIESCDADHIFASEYDYSIVFYQEINQGQSYYLAVYRYPSDEGAFSIQADLIPPGIPGDMCIEAIEMAPNSSIRGSTAGATDFTNCGGTDCRDVWYTLAPSIEGYVRISVATEDGRFVHYGMLKSCGGEGLGACSSYGGHERSLIVNVPSHSDYLIRIEQDSNSTASFVIENQLISTIPVFGRIVDKTTGEGLSGINIWLNPEFCFNYDHRQLSITTDSEGYFILTKDLPEGSYSIVPKRFEDYQLWDLDQKVTLTPGMGPLVLEMVRLAHLEVVCIDAETGEPITDAVKINVCPESWYSDGYNCYDLPGSLPPGLVKVAVYPKDSESGYTSRQEWVYLKGGENRSCIMPMKTGIPIRGTLRHTNGNPFSDSEILFFGENGAFGTKTPDGTFETRILPGIYGCFAKRSVWGWKCYSPWQLVTISEIAEQNEDLELVIYNQGSEMKWIEGTIQDSGSLSLAGPFEVLVLPQGVVPTPNNIFTLQERWWDPSYYPTDTVYLDELPPGDYDLYFGVLSRPKPNFTFTVQDTKLGIPAGTEGLEFVYVSEGSTVAGRVLDPEGIGILVSEIVLNKLSGGEFAGWAKTNPRGQFVFYHVPAGTYTLSAVHRNYTMAQATVTVPTGPSIMTAEMLTMNPKGRREGADFNGDGLVDVDDIVTLAAAWMQDGNLPADLNGSGLVDMADLARIGQTWLGQAVWLNRPAQFPEYPEGLIGLWTLDEQVDLKTVLDWSGNGHHGIAQQNVSMMTQEGMVNYALRFNGTGDYIDYGPVNAQQPAAWTVCAWVKCADTPTPTLLSFGGNVPAVKLQQDDNGKPIVYLGEDNYRYFSASAWTTLKDGLWHHVAFSVPGNDPNAVELAAMYLDGAAVAESTTQAIGHQAAKIRLYIGIDSNAGQQRFKGAMDEVLLFDRALTADEIEKLYRSSR